MKEASGELSMTAVAVIAIVAVGGLFTTLIWPSLKISIKQKTYCASAYSCGTCSSKKMTCSYLDESGVEHNDLTCPCEDTSTAATTISS